MADNKVEVTSMVRQRGNLIQVGYLADVSIDELLGRVAVVVADLVYPPHAVVQINAIAGQRRNQNSALQSQQLLNVQLVQLQTRLFRLLVLSEMPTKHLQRLLERVEIPADEVGDGNGAVLIAEWRAGRVNGHSVVETFSLLVVAGVVDD
jgi:hypothetical protein